MKIRQTMTRFPMLVRLRHALTFAVFACALTAPLQTGAQGSPVPCSKLGRNSARCQNPILEGVVDKQWIAVLKHYNGTNGGPDVLSVVGIGMGADGPQTVSLGVIKPEGQGADRMDAWFQSSKLYVSNAIYLPNEPYCCYSRRMARRFGFQGKKLALERLATVPSGASQHAISATLDRAPSLSS